MHRVRCAERVMHEQSFRFLAERVGDGELAAVANTTDEATRVFAAIEASLRESNLELRDVTKIRLFYAVHSDFPEMNKVRDPLFRSRFPNESFPSSTGVITGGRGKRPNFELEVIAHAGKRAFNADGLVTEWS